jgi:protein phosphatase PTC7
MLNNLSSQRSILPQTHTRYSGFQSKKKNISRRTANRYTLCVARRGNTSIAEPVTSPSLPTRPFLTSNDLCLGGLLATAGLLAWAFKALSTPQHQKTTIQARKTTPHHSLPPPPNQDAQLASLVPTLLAAETAGTVDDTHLLTIEELQKAELDLQMLIQQLDIQLEGLKDILSPKLTEIDINALADIEERMCRISAITEHSISSSFSTHDNNDVKTSSGMNDDELDQQVCDLEWEAFTSIFQPVASEAERRTFRSLLFNRGLQSAALRQVLRQLDIKTSSSSSSSSSSCDQPTESSSYVSTITSSTTNGNNTSEPMPVMEAAGYMIPHPNKVETGGEDAFFITNKQPSSDRGGGLAFGVADGVGGWAELNIDPSEYPRCLMMACEQAVASNSGSGSSGSTSSSITALEVMEAAFERTDAPGSCTATIVVVNPTTYTLNVANIGDCGVRIIRDGALVFETKVQEHAFNQPYQLASPKQNPSSTPADADVYAQVAVQPGDVVIAASDGFFDNIWNQEIVSIVEDSLGGGRDAGVAATVERLATAAAEHSLDRDFVSPWSVEKSERRDEQIQQQQGKGWGAVGQLSKLLGRNSGAAAGGKMDDVTVIVALIL